MDRTSARPGLWGILCQDVAGTLDNDAGDVPPVYERLSLGTGAHIARGDCRPLDAGLPPEPPPRGVTLSRSRSFLQMEVHEPFTYTYHLAIGSIQTQVIILVEPDLERDRPDYYTFSLSMKIGPVERAVSKPVTMKLTINPRRLDFVVFAFPPRNSLPVECLYHLRVWLRTPAGIDHRIFGEQDLWFGRDPDFGTITDASFATLRTASPDKSTYKAIVGRAHVTFVTRWRLVEPGIYALSVDYEAGGVGKALFENYHLRLTCEPHTVTFLIYTIPVPSNPAGASHRLRFWLRTPDPHPTGSTPAAPIHSPATTSSASPPARTPPHILSRSLIRSHSLPHPHHRSPSAPAPAESHLYQRLWKSDEFKIGAHLNFEAIGPKIVLATRVAVGDGDDAPPAFEDRNGHRNGNGNGNTDQNAGSTSNQNMHSNLTPLTPNRRRVSRLPPNVSIDEAGDTVNDR